MRAGPNTAMVWRHDLPALSTAGGETTSTTLLWWVAMLRPQAWRTRWSAAAAAARPPTFPLTFICAMVKGILRWSCRTPPRPARMAASTRALRRRGFGAIMTSEGAPSAHYRQDFWRIRYCTAYCVRSLRPVWPKLSQYHRVVAPSSAS